MRLWNKWLLILQLLTFWVLNDSKYAKKADKRSDGAGTESPIISRQVYEKVQQEKFISIVLEFDDENQPFLPIFFESRIYIDFSTHEHWEQLIRRLYGKPLYQKPKLDKVLLYITEELVAHQVRFKQSLLHLNNLYFRKRKLSICTEKVFSSHVMNMPNCFGFLKNQVILILSKK